MSGALQLAGRGRRLVATSIDAILVPALSIFLVLVTGATEDAEDYISLPGLGVNILALAVLAYLILNGYTLWQQGQTLGKKVMGIAIVDASAQASGLEHIQPAPLWKLIGLRALFFPLLFLLPLWPITLAPLIDQLLIFTARRQTLHDLVAGTVVVKLP